MRSKNCRFSIVILLAIMLSSTGFSQDSANASGGDASGSGGSVAYSIGQVVNLYVSGTNGNVNQGVQQPYEIYLVGTAEPDLGISLIAFPNPTSDVLNLQFEGYQNHDAKLNLISLEGKVLMQKEINSEITQLDISSYAKGIYFLRITQQMQELSSFKVIKN